MEVNEVKERWVASVATSTDLSAKVAELTTTLKEALIDLDPNHPKHGRWNKRVKNSQLTGDRREAFRKHHENLKPFHELAHSSQLKFLSLHVHPRMAELFILAGTGGFTAMLGLWIAKHTQDFHWEGSSGVVKSERYITSLVEMVAVVPKQFDALKGKMAPKIMRAAATSRQFIRLLDDSNMSRMSADRWRRWFKGKVKFPAKGPCLTARKDEAIARDELLGVAVRNETVITHADGSTITNEQFHLDLKRVVVEGMLPVALMESLQMEQAPKELTKEAEEIIKLHKEKIALNEESPIEGFSATATQDKVVKLEEIVSSATRNGSFSRKAFDELMELSIGTMLHNQVRQAREVLDADVKISWDASNLLRTEKQDHSQVTPFFIKFLNACLSVNSTTNTLVWAAGDGKDSLDAQENIIKVVNDFFGAIKDEVLVIERPVLLRALDGILRWVTGIKTKLTADIGLDGAAAMDTVDEEEAACSINSEFRCDRCYIAKVRL
jgi:hypothetical protein